MPDYLSRSPIEDAEEDPDEISPVILQSTQTSFENDLEYGPKVNVVQTRAAKLRDLNNQKSFDNNQTKQIL